MAAKSNLEAIVVGGSWGGMDALIHLLSGLSYLYPLPILTVVHRQRNVASSLPSILAKYTTMKVKEVDDKEEIRAGTVYIAPPNYHVLVEKDRTLSLDVSEDVHFARPSIDILFESAALVYKEKLLGILLTGANSDGSDGLKTIAEMGGTTIVQDPVEAQVDTMPKSALAKMKVDHIFTVYEIQKYLLTVVQ